MRHEFCRGQIILARQDAIDAGIKIGKISASRIHHEHYAVFIGDDFYREYGACCAFDARSQAISEYIDKYKKAK